VAYLKWPAQIFHNLLYSNTGNIFNPVGKAPGPMRVVPAACAVLALAACAHAWSPFLDRLLRPGAAGERRAGYSAQAELDAVHHLPGWGKPAHGLFSGCGRARFVHVLVVATAACGDVLRLAERHAAGRAARPGRAGTSR